MKLGYLKSLKDVKCVSKITLDDNVAIYLGDKDGERFRKFIEEFLLNEIIVCNKNVKHLGVELV